MTTTAAAIYCRISNDADGRMLGITRQERSCRRLAAQRGLDVVGVFVDNDISAFSGDRRPGYLQLLTGFADGRFAAVIAWDGDRLHRSTRELEDFLDVIETTGTTVVTVTSGEVDLVTATGRMQARIKGDVPVTSRNTRGNGLRLHTPRSPRPAAGRAARAPTATTSTGTTTEGRCVTVGWW